MPGWSPIGPGLATGVSAQEDRRCSRGVIGENGREDEVVPGKEQRQDGRGCDSRFGQGQGYPDESPRPGRAVQIGRFFKSRGTLLKKSRVTQTITGRLNVV